MNIAFIAMHNAIIARETANLIVEIVIQKWTHLKICFYLCLKCMFLTKRIENKQKTKFVLWPEKIAIWRHCREL